MSMRSKPPPARAGVMLLLLLMASSALCANDDEAWIERYQRSTASSTAEAARQARTLPFTELKAMVGKPVRLYLLGGRQRRGVVEKATDSHVWLTSGGKSGYFSYDVQRADVARVEQERGQ